MAAYATVDDVQAGFREISEEEREMCTALLDEAAVLIDVTASAAPEDAKRIVSCRMVRRSLGDGSNTSVPIGATQGSMSALGYSQSWTIGNGASGELYLGKTDRILLGLGKKIGCSNPYAEDASA